MGSVTLSAVTLLAPAGAQAATHHMAARHVVHTALHHTAPAHAHLPAVIHHTALTVPHGVAGHHYRHHIRAARYRHSGLQCVPYAREISHIDLSGNAFLWWAEASGRYARGSAPEEGAVLNFRPIGRMPLGHVAVVTSVLDNRTILITQANWVPGTITNDVTVEDVSANNDWSEVQVELGDSSSWGAPYPTYGFIYNRPDTGTVIANGTGSTAQPAAEVAEAPAVTPVSDSAPDRSLQ
jgi:surface antigen